MLYLSHAPHPALAEHVEGLWTLSDRPAHERESILPSGTVELVVNLAEDEVRIYDRGDPERCRRLGGAIVSGTYRGPFVIDTREHASVVGVHFKPGGAFPFLGMPVRELADSHIDLETLWGPTARELRERLCEASTAPDRFRILEEALLARLPATKRRHGAVRFAVDGLGTGGTTVGGLAAEVGLSHRRFIEVFAAEVGLTPKVFGRIRRFQRALDRIGKTARPDWARLALACGYFDQSHFIRELVSFSGLTPEELLRRRSGPPAKDNHVPLPEGQVHPIRARPFGASSPRTKQGRS